MPPKLRKKEQPLSYLSGSRQTKEMERFIASRQYAVLQNVLSNLEFYNAIPENVSSTTAVSIDMAFIYDFLTQEFELLNCSNYFFVLLSGVTIFEILLSFGMLCWFFTDFKPIFTDKIDEGFFDLWNHFSIDEIKAKNKDLKKRCEVLAKLSKDMEKFNNFGKLFFSGGAVSKVSKLILLFFCVLATLLPGLFSLGVFQQMLALVMMNLIVCPILAYQRMSASYKVVFKKIEELNLEKYDRNFNIIKKLSKTLEFVGANFYSEFIDIKIMENFSMKHVQVSCKLSEQRQVDLVKRNVQSIPIRCIPEKYYLDVFKQGVERFFGLSVFFDSKISSLIFYDDRKKVPSHDDDTFTQAAEWIKKGLERLSALERKISKFKEQGGKISIAFEIEDADEYSIKAYASFTDLVSNQKYYELDVEDPSQFPVLAKKSNDYDFNKINNSPAVKEQEQSREKSKTRGIPNPQLLVNQKNHVPPDEFQNPDVCESCEVSAGKYVLRIPQFGLFSTYEQGKIEKALQATADRVDSKTNMPRWLKQDSLGKQGVKRLAVMNNEGSEKGYSLKTNRYKMRLYGAEEGFNAQGQTIIAFKYSSRFGH